MPRSTTAWRVQVLAPAEVVRELNRRLFLRDEANPFFTIAYGVFDQSQGAVRLVRAGHPFPLLLTADGTLRTLKPEGYAVGLFPGSDIATEEFRLEKGDRLFLYSDGLVDCTNSGGMTFSAPHFADLVTEGRGLPLAEQVAAVRREVVAWRGSESFVDDVSLLALERE